MGFLVSLVVSLAVAAPPAPAMVTVTATPAGFTIVKGSSVCVVPAPDAHRAPMVVTVTEDTAHAMFPATAVCKAV